ncbi:leucine-rich repeat-containing protein 17-like [Corythoichthys intestinalis]|uniref:leucine-rich repeat-containing protein 17-like n=1 Tax=Corythoichthys intestinalis TaxID=161448 RepID=UPI0025A54A02|nr:leucine-rich repeat-containing protein 17-like [Corythoichthys intestinalis]XP_061813345.1 leucine-rich repeat-containing protein 17-like [Nerophis lumbriciformis]
MRVTSSFIVVSLLLLLLLFPFMEMKRAGKGKGLKRARQKMGRDRVKGVGRHSRSDPPKPANCTESLESGHVFADCQERRLTSIPKHEIWSRAPKYLLLARNRIKVLRDGAFAGYESLTSLDLQQNHISLVEEEAFEGLTRLTTLLLQHNRLTSLGEEALIPMPNLRYLRFYDNPLNCHCDMDSLVQTLQVPSNRNLGNHARCAEPLRLKGIKLKRIDPELLCKKFDPDEKPQGDQTDPIDPAEPSHFQNKPDATASCHIYYFPHVRVDCSNRGLTEVPIGIPEEAVQIDLSHNSIRHLKAKSFQGAKHLKTLNLSHNNMERIDTASLYGLLHLRELDLSDNNLYFIQYGVLEDLYFLSKLKLGGNPWLCDYSIHYMVYWLKLHPVVRHSGLLCRSPLEYTGDRVEDYVRAYNQGCVKDRQQSQRDPTEEDELLWNSLEEAQGEPEEEIEPSHLMQHQKYQIIRLS